MQAPDRDVAATGSLRGRALAPLPVDRDQAGSPWVMHPALFRDCWQTYLFHERIQTRYRRRFKDVGSGCGLGFIPYGIVRYGMNGEQKVTRAIERASQRVRRYLAAQLDQLGVTEIEAHLLARLASKGPCSVAEVQGAFGLRPSTLTNALDRLERKGFLLRQIHPADRRTFLLALTTPGREAARLVVAEVDVLEARVTGRVSADQLAAFHAVVAAIEDSLQ
jgi:DNA-binding MarR family transcriptional regulator